MFNLCCCYVKDGLLFIKEKPRENAFERYQNFSEDRHRLKNPKFSKHDRPMFFH